MLWALAASMVRNPAVSSLRSHCAVLQQLNVEWSLGHLPHLPHCPHAVLMLAQQAASNMQHALVAARCCSYSLHDCCRCR